MLYLYACYVCPLASESLHSTFKVSEYLFLAGQLAFESSNTPRKCRLHTLKVTAVKIRRRTQLCSSIRLETLRYSLSAVNLHK